MSRIAACRAACDAIDAAPSPRSAAVFLLTAAALLSAAVLESLPQAASLVERQQH
jgi:hypothetical protein